MPLGTPTLAVTVDPDGFVVLVLSCTGATKGTIKRVTPSGSINVRDGLDRDMTSGLVYVSDYEIPQSVELSYWAQVTDGTATASTAVITVPGLDRGVDWIAPLGDPLDGMAVNVEQIDDLTYETTQDTAKVLNRPDPVVVTWGRHLPRGTLTLITLNDNERVAMQTALNSARILLFQPRIGFGFEEPLFLSVDDVREIRPAALGREQARRWQLEFQQVAPPPPQFTIAFGTTWQEVLAANLTWTQRQQAALTWRQLTGV